MGAGPRLNIRDVLSKWLLFNLGVEAGSLDHKRVSRWAPLLAFLVPLAFLTHLLVWDVVDEVVDLV